MDKSYVQSNEKLIKKTHDIERKISKIRLKCALLYYIITIWELTVLLFSLHLTRSFAFVFIQLWHKSSTKLANQINLSIQTKWKRQVLQKKKWTTTSHTHMCVCIHNILDDVKKSLIQLIIILLYSAERNKSMLAE